MNFLYTTFKLPENRFTYLMSNIVTLLNEMTIYLFQDEESFPAQAMG